MTNILNYKWGGRWDSNPRSPVPQTGALTSYATSTIYYLYFFKRYSILKHYF